MSPKYSTGASKRWRREAEQPAGSALAPGKLPEWNDASVNTLADAGDTDREIDSQPPTPSSNAPSTSPASAPRACDKVLRVARTLADPEDSDAIRENHVAEAIQYRSLDRQLL